MNLRQKSGRQYSDMNFVENNVVVAVKATKGISKSALIWALTNVVQPGDCVRLLVIIPTHSSGNKLWGFPRFHSDCANGYWRSMFGTLIDQKDYITGLCNQMMSRLKEIYDPAKVRVKMKVIYDSKHGVVASEAKKAQTQWVVLDKRMKREAKSCMEQLECNVVIVKNSEPKFLRLNLIERIKMESEVLSVSKSFIDCPKDVLDEWDAIKVPNVTPSSSPESTTSPATFGRISSSISSQEMLTTPSFLSEAHWDSKVKHILPLSLRDYDIDESDSESDSDHRSSFSTSICSQRWMEDILSSADESSKYLKQGLQRSRSKARNPFSESFPGEYSELNKILGRGRKGTRHDNSKNVREMILSNKNAPPDPPPLCTICQHKAPFFGKAPRMFSYSELEQATSGFSEANFLAEGGYGSVHRGVLLDGRVIAVKQHKLASTQGDREFCSEVQVLSCAQHRNVVMLIGYCVEGRRRLLVYEYVCGGSLDSHLYGRGRDPLDWPARQKIAVGAARGLRYLHEECRVGCIVHRDMRPNNILLTHDFEALVGDFGLARLQPDGDSSVETSIIGTFGYLAPEYAQSGQVTDKADIFSFGVVLVELITGRKAVDINRPKGEQCLTEWARPLLEENNVSKLVDPCLKNCYLENEIQTMMHCANSCLQRDPSLRPRMSQVLRMLEGDIFLR